MEEDFAFDVFLSYSETDRDEAMKVFRKFEICGLRAFEASHNMGEKVGHADWEEHILAQLGESDHLVVFCSMKAAESKWVEREVRHFDQIRKTRQESSRDNNRHMILAIRDPRLSRAEQDQAIGRIEPLRPLLHPEHADDAVEHVARSRIERLVNAIESTRTELDRAQGQAKSQLEQAKKLARQSFDYYRHARFWKPFSEAPGERLHIFTCGRDTPPEPGNRGSGGRTNIDIWDYQAAVDITHYFARHHRDTGVFIEQPMSKSGIDEDTRTFDTHEYSKLLNHNCVVIGSPDVSDFAEITLATVLGVRPYSPQKKLEVGFRIRKAGKRFSTFYQAVDPGRQGGIELWDGEFFQASEDKDFGVLVLADNPFSERPNRHKMLILAGHSGVATRALSLLLTSDEDWCLEAFYGLDQQAAVINGPIAAVVEAAYLLKRHQPGGAIRATQGDEEAGDKREIRRVPAGIQVRRVIDLGRFSTVRSAEDAPDVITLPRTRGVHSRVDLGDSRD